MAGFASGGATLAGFASDDCRGVFPAKKPNIDRVFSAKKEERECRRVKDKG